MSSQSFDLIIVGAGVIGLAHAHVAAQRGLKVAVVERDHRCVGASIRNFGFVTVTGQRPGDTWRRACRSRDVWQSIAPAAGISVEHRGLWLLARHAASLPVLEAFMGTAMGEECKLLSATEAAAWAPYLRTDGAVAALYSPHELRIESRTAITLLAHWLQEAAGVTFFYGEEVLDIQPPAVRTARRTLHAERVVVCPGTELNGVAQQWLQEKNLRLTRLQMLRVRPEPGFRLDAAVMGDLSLVRYHGYADLAPAAALREHLLTEESESLGHGIHLIAVQSRDGTLVVGDSHHDDASPEPFASEAVDRLILRQLGATLQLEQCEVVERWTGVYPTGGSSDCLIVAPDTATRVVVVTSGSGASTAFGIAEDVFNNW